MDDSPNKRKRESVSQEGSLKLQAVPHQQQRSDLDPYTQDADLDMDGSQAANVNSDAQQPWYAAFPEPTMAVDLFPRQRALMVMSMRIASILIVDVRRNDYQGGAIRGSLNIPAQGFWWNRGMLYELAYKSDMEWVIFTCGSSNGRAPRCAAWFLDHVRNTVGDDRMHVSVLEGGIKGWIKSGPQYIEMMDGFQVEHWERVFAEEARQASQLPDDAEPIM